MIFNTSMDKSGNGSTLINKLHGQWCPMTISSTKGFESAATWLLKYHAAENKFERFRRFLQLISRFEFEFRRCGNYIFERFEFLVRSCECAVAWLCPRNSISNVVASLTVHDNIYIYISMKPLWKVSQIVRYTWV